MCGRFTLTRQDRRELAGLLGVDEKDLRDYQQHYNIARMLHHFVIGSKYETRRSHGASTGVTRHQLREKAWNLKNCRLAGTTRGEVPVVLNSKT
jgi:putative SOS response-associated peptidase YedK